MYLGKSAKRSIQLGLMGLSAVLLINGGWKALANPQSYSAADLQAIHESGIEGKAVHLAGQKTAAVVGIVQMALAGGCLALAGMVAETTPTRILPKSLDPQDTPLPDLPAQANALAALRSRLADLLSEHPWLKQCIACESLIIIAPAGSGKSSIASVIGFLRAIFRGHRIMILDPHGAINVERGVWLLGDVLESETEILGSQAEITARHTKETAHTAILDEFGSLCDDKNSKTAKLAGEIVGNAIRNNRKFCNHYIFLCHGRNKGQMGGEAMPSGYLASWTEKSAVLELEADYSEWGEAEFSGRGRFKPSGTGFEDLNAYQPLQVPAFLNPQTIRREFAHLFAHLGLSEAKQEPQKPQYNPKLMKLIDEALSEENLSGVKTLFEQIYNSSKDEAQCTSVDPAQAIASLSDRALQLLRYYFGNGQKFVDADGWIEVKTLRVNWARHQEIKGEQLREILAETITAELALMEESRWKPRVAKTDLPDEDGECVD